MAGSEIISAPATELGPDNFAQYGSAMVRWQAHAHKTVVEIPRRITTTVTMGDRTSMARTLELRWRVDDRSLLARIVHNYIDGTIRCRYCNRPVFVAWCSHIRHVMLIEADAAFYEIPEDEGWIRVLVPIVPTEGVFVPVTVKRVEVRGVTASALYLWPDPTEAGDPGVDPARQGAVHLATLVGQVSTTAVRNLVIDFIDGWSGNSALFIPEDEVTAPTAPAEAALEASIGAWSRRWHGAVTGTSYGCYQFATFGGLNPDTPTW